MSIRTDPLFNPPDQEWEGLDPAYVKQCRITSALSWTLWVVISAVIVFFLKDYSSPLLFIIPVVFVCIGIWRVWRQRAIVDAWGYIERDSDLYIRRGIWMRQLTVIPYGRMQAVEVHSGPIGRLFGLSSVELVTASASSNAIIHGLARDKAMVLRDSLTERGEDQAAGL